MPTGIIAFERSCATILPETGAGTVMAYDDQLSDIRALLWEHAHPTLRNLDHNRIAKLAEKVLRIASNQGLWTKWDSDREEVAERAANLWIPLDDLREALNALPGPALTKVDVEQRIRALLEKQYGSYPDSNIEAECLAVFAEGKAKGTEFIAVLGYMEEWYWGAEERLRLKQEKERRDQSAKEKQIAEARLRNGADCPWTAATNIVDLHCRRNGRLYRLQALQTTNKFEPAFEVLRVDHLEAKKGRSVGRYRIRGDATKAVANVAWQVDDL